MPKGDIYKLKADLEDGYTQIARLFLVALPLCQLSGLEVRCILYLWSVTYGWMGEGGKKKKQEALSLKKWSRYTGSSESNISKALAVLAENGVIKRNILGMGKGYLYEMNTHIDEWSERVIKKETLRELVGVSKPTTTCQTDKGFQTDNHLPNRQGFPNRQPLSKRTERGCQTDNSPLVETATPLASVPASPKEITLNKRKEEVEERQDNIIKSSVPSGDSVNPEKVITIAEVAVFYTENFGAIKPFVAESLRDFCENYPPASVLQGFREALLAHAKSELRYVQTYLEKQTSGILVPYSQQKSSFARNNNVERVPPGYILEGLKNADS